MEGRVTALDSYKTLVDKLHRRNLASAHLHIPMREYQQAVVDSGSIPPSSVTYNPSWIDEAKDIDQHVMDALRYKNLGGAGTTVRAEKTLADFKDAELVMEMIRRGYAAMKLPSDGGPPEVLR